MPGCEWVAQEPARAVGFSLSDWFRRLIIASAGAATGLTALALLVAAAAPIELVPPSSLVFPLIALAYLVRTLSLHAGLIVLALLPAVIWLRRWRLAGAVALVGAWCVAPALWDYRPHSAPAVTGEPLKLMTCNLLRLNRHVDEIADEVLATAPDVVCFQECSQRWHDGLTARLAERYPYRIFRARRFDMGLAIYSRQPLDGASNVTDWGDDPPAQPLRTELTLGSRRIALYNIHMYQPWPWHNMAWHQRQLAGLLASLRQETLPFVLAGDFNSTPTSPTLARLEKTGLADAWHMAGWGRGSTWPDVRLMRHLPGIRIDHVYLSPQLACTACAVGVGAGSDHRPVTATIGFRTESIR